MSGWIDRESTGLKWRERPGSDATLVMLHGIGSNAGSFDGLAAYLPERYRLLAWNAPGYLGSRRLDMEWPTASNYADALHTSLLDIGVSRAFVLGHSLGTLIGTAYAQAHPEGVTRIVLSASAQGYGGTPGAPLPPKAAERVNDLRELGPAAFAAARAPRLLADPDATPEAAAKVEAAMAQVEPEGYGQAARMLACGDLAGSLKNLQVPCDFIIGTQDVITPRAQTEAAAAAVGPAARIEEIANTGHALYLERPEAFASAVLRLIETDDAPPSEGGQDG